MVGQQTKPSFDAWLRWADVLARRLDTIRHVYGNEGRAEDAAAVAAHIGVLQRVIAGEIARLAGEPDAEPSRPVPGGEYPDDAHIRAIAWVFRDVLKDFPAMSKDMQKHFGVTWNGEGKGRIASDIFKGPRGSVNEGIGSGDAADGHLPGVMDALLRQEDEGMERPPATGVLAADERKRRLAIARRWADENSRHLRRAGAIE